MRIWWAAPLAMSVALGGCGSIGAIGLHPFSKGGEGPVAEAAPTPTVNNSVEASNLPPPDSKTTTGSTGMAVAEANGGTPPGANGAPLTAGADVNRTDLLGGWTLTNGSESCQLFMTLTSWTGGYRASTRGCNSDSLKSISAWNIDGKQVVLAGAGGAPLANLAASAQGKFAGQMVNGGTQISFYR